ncbi:MAG TPA: hypothetical protein VN742_09625 [Candidatus Binataceae bacterium]|nr:hypothetical protein [Candidatus Binataceae bacterium]
MALAPRSINSIEHHLLGQLGAVSDGIVAAPPFVDEDGTIDDGEYAGLPLRLALDLRNRQLLDAEQILRRQLIVAHEIGPTRPDGGPFTSEYEIACQAEGVNPWPLGDKLTIENKEKSPWPPSQQVPQSAIKFFTRQSAVSKAK